MKWTKNSVDLLRDVWRLENKSNILSVFPGRTWRSLRGMAERIGLNRPKKVASQWLGPLPDWLIGEMLSDGCIDRCGRYAHTTKYFQYADFLRKKFGGMGLGVIVNYDSRIDKRTGNRYSRWLLKTRTVFKRDRDIWYPNGKKSVPYNLKLSDEAVLHLLIGDGNADKRGSRITVATMGFERDSILRLVLAISECGLKASVFSEGILYFRRTRDNTNSMKRIITSSAIPSCYSYKIDAIMKWCLGGRFSECSLKNGDVKAFDL